jgi:uncharacterized membrane protein (UPF0127 family)
MHRRTLIAALSTLAVATPLAAGAQDTSKAQAELPKEPLAIITRDGVRHDFTVEMALSLAQQEVGLMFRPTVPADGGMLFDWGAPRVSNMWMRNTVSPLDMVFINADGTIRRIEEDTVPESLAVIPSGGPVRATLELAAGAAKRLGLRPGDKVEARVLQTRQ